VHCVLPKGAKVQIGLRPVQKWWGESIEYRVWSIGRDKPWVAGGSPGWPVAADLPR